MNNIKIIELDKSSRELFKNIKNTFSSSSNNKIVAIAAGVPETIIDGESPINVVFAGQYGAGKSTILSLLTGEKLETGGGVTTQNCQELEWNSIHVIDTPGIHTQNRPDHDQITYDAIAKADLIVFVITNELFSDHLGKHFQKLLFEKQKGKEIMLVVNKMGDETLGNCTENQEIKGSEIKKVITPYEIDELYTTFIDSKSLLESFEETDIEDKEWLEEVSGWDVLQNNLNKFIKDKRLIGRYTTALFKVEQQLLEALAEFKSGDTCTDLLKIDLVTRRGELVSSQARILEKIEEISSKHKTQIQKWGDEIAVELSSSDKKETVQAKLDSRFNDVNEEMGKMVKELENYLNIESGRLQQNLDDFSSSDLGRMTADAINSEIKNLNLDPKNREGMQKAAGASKNIGEFIIKHATGPGMKDGASNILKLGGYSGSKIHEGVKWVGHAFGHKFAPWEAVKWARGIGNAGRVLGVAGAGLGFVLQIANDRQEDKAERQLIQGRSEIRSAFVDASNVIDLRFDEDSNTWVADNYGKAIKEVDDRLEELESMTTKNNNEVAVYEQYLKEVRNLIAIIQENYE